MLGDEIHMNHVYYPRQHGHVDGLIHYDREIADDICKCIFVNY